MCRTLSEQWSHLEPVIHVPGIGPPPWEMLITVARRVIFAWVTVEENGDKNFWKLNEELVFPCAEVDDGRRRSNSPDKEARGFIISQRIAGDGGFVYGPC
jgi:hypothetical protein